MSFRNHSIGVLLFVAMAATAAADPVTYQYGGTLHLALVPATGVPKDDPGNLDGARYVFTINTDTTFAPYSVNGDANFVTAYFRVPNVTLAISNRPNGLTDITESLTSMPYIELTDYAQTSPGTSGDSIYIPFYSVNDFRAQVGDLTIDLPRTFFPGDGSTPALPLSIPYHQVLNIQQTGWNYGSRTYFADNYSFTATAGVPVPVPAFLFPSAMAALGIRRRRAA